MRALEVPRNGCGSVSEIGAVPGITYGIGRCTEGYSAKEQMRVFICNSLFGKTSTEVAPKKTHLLYFTSKRKGELDAEDGCVSTMTALSIPQVLTMRTDRQIAGMGPLIIQLQ